MNTLTFGLTSSSKSLAKAVRFWQFCEEARLRGQPMHAHTHTPLVIFPPSCIVFHLNDPLPSFCSLEQNIINWITAPLLDQRSPPVPVSGHLGGGGWATVYELQLLLSRRVVVVVVWRLHVDSKSQKAWFGFSWRLCRWISEANIRTKHN